MSARPVVLKFGGDALASADRITAAARRAARRAERQPVVVIASARRGITDQLVDLTQRVSAGPGLGPIASRGARAAADRAVTAGEIVSASLLALALERMGIQATAFDAREAGLLSDGRFGGGSLRTIRTRRVERLLDQGGIPVVAGFQGWHRGKVTALGRGGSDISAVAIGAALSAERCEFIKDAPGLMTADPKVVPAARPILRTSHRFLTLLAEAGARVVHPAAARLAEQHELPLRFASLEDEDAPGTVVEANASGSPTRGVTWYDAGDGWTLVSAVWSDPAMDGETESNLGIALRAAGIAVGDLTWLRSGLRLAVPSVRGPDATRIVHAVCVERDGSLRPTLSAAG